MRSKEIYRLTTIIIYVTILLVFIHYTSSQPLSASPKKDDDILDNSIRVKPSSSFESNEFDVKNYESIPEFYMLRNEYDLIKQEESSEPVRRANFWKRANFWRKRANFWRRDTTS